MNKLTFKIPAKINLYLRLTGKRKDGYNNICTVFQKIALFDTLLLRKAKRGFQLDCKTGIVPCPPKRNLIYRAYQLLKKETSFKGGLHVTLDKYIPAGSGLGGASADAAYTLLGINRLYRLGLNRSKLIELGGEIGADVPLFVYPFPSALGIGRGDMLISLDLKRRYWLIIVIFDKTLATKNVYKSYSYPPQFRINLTKLSREVIMLSQFFQRRELVSLGGMLKNDLCIAACSLMPEIKAVLKVMKRACFPAYGMTGSGPTVFALFNRKIDAITAQKKLLSYEGIKAIVSKTLY